MWSSFKNRQGKKYRKEQKQKSLQYATCSLTSLVKTVDVASNDEGDVIIIMSDDMINVPLGQLITIPNNG